MIELSDFVTINNGPGCLYGVGQVTFIDDNDEHCTVSFFESPGQIEENIDVCIDDLSLADLFAGTRVYYQQDSNWFSGRIVGTDRGTAEVKFDKNLLNPGFFPFSDIRVRRAGRMKSPTLFLSQKIWDTKYLADRRFGFLKCFDDMRHALGGMTGYFSASIELEKHQFDVVKTVCENPIQRFLLADEVGLGKTIEAGSIIRQYALDFPNDHLIMIIVPDHLTHQWKSELVEKFQLRHHLERTIDVYGYSQKTEISRVAAKAGMIVIDEAHNISSADNYDLYSILLRETKTLPRLLLLSATPAQHNEERYFDMLRLLDPAVYKEGEYSKFQTKLSNAQALNEIVSDLTPEGYFFFDDSIEKLNEMFPHDNLLSNYGSELLDLVDKGYDETNPILHNKLQELRSYIQEQYKIDHRILRNRRENIKGLTPERSAVEYIDIYDEQRSNFLFALNNLSLAIQFSALTDQEKNEFYFWSGEVTASFCKRICLDEINSSFLKTSPKFIPDQFANDWQNLTTSFEQISKSSWNELIVQRMVGYLLKENINKAIIFCSSEASAREISENLQYVEDQIVSFDIANKGSQEINAFHEHQGNAVLLCGGEVEEGLNLNGISQVIINYDLPLNPNRLEQRIGRVDRFGSSEFSVVNIRDTSNDVETKVHDLYRDILGVFNRSIASLQRSLEQHFGNLIALIGKDGIAAIENLSETLSGDGGVKAEEDFIKQQEVMLALADRGDSSFDKILGIDQDWNRFRKICQSWLIDCLKFRDTPALYYFWVKQNRAISSVNDFWSEQSGKTLRWTASGSLNEISKIIESLSAVHKVGVTFVPVASTSEAFRMLRDNELAFVAVNDTHARKIAVNSNFAKLGDGNVEGSEKKRLVLSNSSELSANTVFEKFNGSIDPDYSENRIRLGHYKVHTNEYSFRRQTALKHKLQLMTVGSEVLDAVKTSSDAEFLGRCYVNWRAFPNHECEKVAEPYIGFQILIEANIEPAAKEVQSAYHGSTSNLMESLRKQTAVFLKPSYVTVWLDQNHLFVQNENLVTILNKDFSSNAKTNGYLDQELTPQNVEALFNHLLSDQYESWSQFVLDGEKQVLQPGSIRQFISEDLDHLAEQFAAQEMKNLEFRAKRNETLRGTEFSLNNLDFEQERTVIKKLAEGIKAPNVSVECVGVQFLSNKKIKV